MLGVKTLVVLNERSHLRRSYKKVLKKKGKGFRRRAKKTGQYNEVVIGSLVPRSNVQGGSSGNEFWLLGGVSL